MLKVVARCFHSASCGSCMLCGLARDIRSGLAPPVTKLWMKSWMKALQERPMPLEDRVEGALFFTRVRDAIKTVRGYLRKEAV